VNEFADVAVQLAASEEEKLAIAAESVLLQPETTKSGWELHVLDRTAETNKANVDIANGGDVPPSC
jgi:hypothetical protein